MNNLKNMFSVGVSLFNVQNLNNAHLKNHCIEKYSNNKQKNFDDKILIDLKSAFLNEGVNHVKQILGTNKDIQLKIHKIWGNTHLDESISVPHTHRESIISAVYYLTKGKLTFLNPYQSALAHIYNKDIENYNEFNSDIWTCDMVEGDMVMFNSHLQHYAHYDGQDKHERMSIACDMIMIND
jgi:hypothetical protein|tara:strand:+ start:2775 stop:3320 length:546 start_codon:yes stop_codon:yes gene_type:complete